MNPDLEHLQPYPFEKLRALLEGVKAASKPGISLSIGEPKHAPPGFVLEALAHTLPELARYPTTRGTDELRGSIARWLVQRYHLSDAEALAAKHVLPVNGTREGLFSIAQCLFDRNAQARLVLMPNPFYQIYEGAALLAGAEPAFYAIDDRADDNLAAIEETGWASCQLLYLCNPGNPTGAVISQPALQAVIEKAHRFGFTIVSDECYSEIYREAAGAPCGLLQAAHAMGNTGFSRCLAFHSLSKRSNLPGLRSGFVAGDANLIKTFTRYRNYHGCTLPLPVQAASTAAWADEQHVIENRAAYDRKFAAVVPLLQQKLPVQTPPAGFYLWPQLPVDDQSFARQLHAEQNLAVVPGSYLARTVNGVNPGHARLRLALVAKEENCIQACHRLLDSLESSPSASIVAGSAG